MLQTNQKNELGSKDAFDLSQNRRSLRQWADEYQNKQKQPTMQVVYDSAQRRSYVRERTKKEEVKEVQVQTIVNNSEQIQQTSIFQHAKKYIVTIAATYRQKTLPEAILSLGSILFNALKFEELDWLESHYNRFKYQQLAQIPYKYITKMKKAIQRSRFQVPNGKISQKTWFQFLECLSQLQSIYDSVQHSKKKIFQFSLKRQRDYILMMMISAYKVFSQSQYTIYKRFKLKELLKMLEKDCSSFTNSVQVLRFLESKDSLLEKLQPLNQLDLTVQVVKIIDNHIKNNKIQSISTKINLVKVSQAPHRRKIVNLLISGFLSEDVDKKQQWNQLLACMPNSEVYGLQWQSNTINQLVKFFAISIKDMIMGKDVNQVITKDNPFVPAFQVSIEAGNLLAYVVHELFPHQFINIISYSLGSQLIRAFLQKTIQLNGGVNINKVITMGGVSDIEEFRLTLQKSNYSINILNVRTKHDSVLKYMLKRSKPNLKPLGLNDVNQNIKYHWVKNMDVSDKIRGHFSFMTNFGTIAQMLMLNQE